MILMDSNFSAQNIYPCVKHLEPANLNLTSITRLWYDVWDRLRSVSCLSVGLWKRKRVREGFFDPTQPYLIFVVSGNICGTKIVHLKLWKHKYQRGKFYTCQNCFTQAVLLVPLIHIVIAHYGRVPAVFCLLADERPREGGCGCQPFPGEPWKQTTFSP